MSAAHNSTKHAAPSHAERAEQFLSDLNVLFIEASRQGSDRAFLQRVLDAAIRATAAGRGFLTLVHYETGDLEVCATSGDGWTEPIKEMPLHLAEEATRGITGHVALTAQPYMSANVDSDPHYLRYFADVRSEAAVPILGASGATRGVITVDSPQPNAFDADDLAHMTALAHAAAIALGIEGFRARESALSEIGKTLTTTLDVDKLTKKLVSVIAGALRFEDCSVFLLDEQTGKLVLHASRGELSAQIGSATYDVGEGLTGWVAEHGEPIRIQEVRNDRRWRGRYVELPVEEIGAFLAVPIISRDKTIGVLRVLRRKSHSPWFDNRFTEGDEQVLHTLASQLGASIASARTHQRLIRAERMAAWGEMSARSAHMIGNRTFALKGDLNELNYLLEHLPQDDRCKELKSLADSMSRGVERLDELLREFRDFVVATQLSISEADINALVQETAEEGFPKRCCLELVLELEQGIPPLQVDEKKLRRAFSELIENAISFQPESGEVRITSRLLSAAERSEARLPQGRSFVQIVFADKGPGVPSDLKERIFQPFYTSRVKGMGLGLSIVKGIIEAHQGILRETGVPGEGARFEIYLPVG